MPKKIELEEAAGSGPDVPGMAQDFRRSVSEGNGYWRRAEQNYRTRYCVWANQSEDGRKWKAPNGRSEPFPWKGASDARVNLVDKYLKKDKAFLVTVWRRMRIRAEGVEANDLELGSRLTQVLRWLKYTQMTESRREVPLLADTMLHRGTAFLGVFWCRETQLGYEEIDRETLAKAGMMATEALNKGVPSPALELVAGVLELLNDPGADAATAEVLQLLYPDVKPGAALQAVRELRESGSARVVVPYTLKDRPTIWAGAPQEDILMPPEMTTDVAQARYLQRRELVTETTLRGRVSGMHWSKQWVDEVIRTQRGRITTTLARRPQDRNPGMSGADDPSKLFEVVHDFRRLSDENGVPGLYYTCFSPGLVEGLAGARALRGNGAVAYHELLTYEHGEYPFLLFESETISRRIGEARGYGEIASTWQQQIKAEWDSRIDRASIATLPPSFHPPGMAPDEWGPGTRVPTNRQEDFGFAKIPPWDPMSKEVQETVQDYADDYFAQRTTDEGDPGLVQGMRQCMADDWMAGWKAVDTQVLQLCQQFMPEEFYYRVVGSAKAKPIRATRDEIQGKFDVTISYNVEDLDPAKKKEKLEAIDILQRFDATGRLDRDVLLEVVAELIDPNMGERLLRPAEEASRAEIEDEQTVFARMFAGIGVDIKPGQNYALRMRVLENILATNPVAQSRYQQEEYFRDLIDTRIKQLQFQEQQKTNAKIGAFYGAKPSPQTIAMEGTMQRPGPGPQG